MEFHNWRSVWLTSYALKMYFVNQKFFKRWNIEDIETIVNYKPSKSKK